MPKYTFECEAEALRFERSLKMGVHSSHPCPSCGQPAPQVMSGFGFSFAEGQGPVANSGVHDHDYPSADKAVGRDAAKSWAHIRAREQAKKQVREQGGTHALIRKTGPGYIDYETMSASGRDARKRLAMDALDVMRPKKTS